MRSRATRVATAGLALALITGCHSTPPPTPVEQLNAQQAEGYRTFQTRCGFCHNERVDEAKRGPSLAGVYKKHYLPSGAPANDDRISNTVLHGHGLMPAQPDIDPDSLAALLAYLRTV